MLIERTTPVPSALADSWLALTSEALASADAVPATAAMSALRAFAWSQAAAEVFLHSLQTLEHRPESFVTAVLNNAAEIVALGRQAPAQGLYSGTQWQLYVLHVGGDFIHRSAQLLRILVPRVKRDGEAAELHRNAIPLFVAYFKFATSLLECKRTELGDAVDAITEIAFATIAVAFDVPEIIEAVLRVLIALALQDSPRMASDPVSVWMPLSIILVPDFSPLDRQWVPIVIALIQYHRTLAIAQPAAFYATLEGAIGQFMEPAPIVHVFREEISRIPPAHSKSPMVITQALVQAYVQLHEHALSSAWVS
jgi:hypothetical protein